MPRFTAWATAALAGAPSLLPRQQPTNPVQGSAVYLGNVTSSNTLDGRDLGFSGKIGNCWINTFGDTFECQQLNPQKGCNFAAIDARNSGGFLTSDSPLTYADINYNSTTKRVTSQFVPHIGSETSGYGLGITNVLPTGPYSGIIYYLAGNGSYYNCGNSTCFWFAGAGWATISVDYLCDVTVNRPQIHQWNGNTGSLNETYYGDHGAIIAQDGLLYVYGSIPNVTGVGLAGVGLARVNVSQATNLTAYQYWNGGTFQSARIYNPTAAISVFNQGQGTVVWNPYYSRYIYFVANQYGGCIYALTASLPQGPWSAPSACLWSADQQPYKIGANGTGGFQYTPTFQPRFSDPNGKYAVLWYTNAVNANASYDGQGHQITTAINITFT